MSFSRRTVCAFVVSMTAGASAASAASIDIGLFHWQEDFIFGGFNFVLQNDTKLHPAALQRPFENLQLTLTLDEDVDNDLIPDVYMLPIVTTLSQDPLAPNSLFEPFAPLVNILSARLQFRYAPPGLPVLEYDNTFAGPSDDPIFLTYEYDSATLPLPEAALIYMLVPGITFLMARSRWLSARRRSHRS